MKILLVEDSVSAAALLAKFVEEQGGKVIGPYHSGEALMEELPDLEFDYALLDVNLEGEISGVQIASKIKRKGIPFIFVTSSVDPESLKEMSKVGPAGFVVKPFTQEEVVANIELLKLRFPLKADVFQEKLTFSGKDGNDEPFAFSFDEILYIQSARNYCEIFTLTGRALLRFTLTKIKEVLPDSRFVQIHRGIIVNVKSVTFYSGDKVFVDRFQLPVGSSYKAQLLEHISKGE